MATTGGAGDGQPAPPERTSPTIGLAETAVRLRAAVGRTSKALRATGGAGGLSPSTIDALGTIVRRGPLRPSHLAALEGLNPTMLSRLAARLEQQGLIERSIAASDGRGVTLAATAAGRRMHEEILARRAEVLSAALLELDRNGIDTLRAALPALEMLARVLAASRSWAVGEQVAPASEAADASERAPARR